MIQVQAAVMNKKRIFLNSSLNLLKLYIWLTKKFTGMSEDLIRSLMESCRNNVICENDDIRTLIPIQTINYPDALSRALNIQSQATMFKMKQGAYPETKQKSFQDFQTTN